MLKIGTYLLSLGFALAASADPQPLLQDVTLKNAQFSKMIFDALSPTAKIEESKKGRVTTQTINIEDGFVCNKVTAANASQFTCTLLAPQWNVLSSDGKILGSSSNEKLCKGLYDTLSVKEEQDSAGFTKTIELNVELSKFQTERNQLSVRKVDAEFADAMGVRPYVCSLINAL